jgi:hypothetical protein
MYFNQLFPAITIDIILENNFGRLGVRASDPLPLKIIFQNYFSREKPVFGHRIGHPIGDRGAGSEDETVMGHVKGTWYERLLI